MPDILDMSTLKLLLGQIATSPSMKKMAELDAIAKKHGFDPKLVEVVIPAITRFIIDAQTNDKLGEAAEFLALVMASASEFGPEMAKFLESAVGGQST